MLANDGALRWTGDLVGKLIAGDDVLRPRLRIVADEHLTGPARELVQTRLDLWLKTHIEKVLAPLFSLTAADDVTGMARGVAFQLVEALGVLERQKVAEEVKGLDQPARATLRKYGVRFGAYHIYLPILLKPAPRALATQLWALKHESPDAQGVAELLHLAASGRTSIPVDKDTPKSLYRTAGYRIAGERAVRVDILERLADLIRPALSWREGRAGAEAGRRGRRPQLHRHRRHDLADRRLRRGFRLDPALARLPHGPPAKTGGAKPAEAKPAAESRGRARRRQAEAAGRAARPTAAETPVRAHGRAPLNRRRCCRSRLWRRPCRNCCARGGTMPRSRQTASREMHSLRRSCLAPDAACRAAECCADCRRCRGKCRRAGQCEKSRLSSRSGARPAAPSAARTSRAVRAASAPRPRRRPGAAADRSRCRAATLAAAADAAAAGGKTAEPKSADRSRDRERARSRLPPGPPRPQGKGRAPRPARRRHGQARRGGRPRRRDKGDRVERAEREQYYAKPHGQRADRNKQPDPNSPFAKLAALKQQLEQNTKEPT